MPVCKVTPLNVVAEPQLQDVTWEGCRGDVIRYISRHVDVSYEVLANYDDLSLIHI